MSASWQVHWISSLLARRQLSHLAPDILVRTLLIVGVGEFLAMLLFRFLHVRMGLWAAILDVFVLTLVTSGPLYWLVLRPAAQLATRAAAASAEAHFQAVVEAVSDAIVITEADGAIAFANPAAEPMFGFELKKLIGWPLSVLLPRGSRPGRTEAEGCRRDGSRFPAEVSTRVVVIGERELRVTLVRDITRRRQIEWELARLASFPQLDPNPIFECDAEGSVTYANPAALRLLQSLGGPEPAARLLPQNLPALVRACLGGCDDRRQAETPVDGRTLLWSLYALPESQRVRIYGVDITQRQRAEEALQERMSLATFVNDVSRTLTQAETLRQMLQQCSEELVRRLDAAFSRIWTLNPKENVLELQASAGMYTHLDGAHSRVPVGQYKIGLIAQDRRPHLTNQVIGDPRVHDQDWARREGMVAFAGYPLLLGDELVGVMATFARQPLTEAALQAMASVANQIALGIKRRRAEEALRESEERFRLLVEALPVAVRVVQDGRLRFINSAGAALYGYGRPEELLDTDSSSQVSEEDRARLREYMQKRAAGEEAPTRYEFRGRRRDGSLFPAEATVARIIYREQVASLAVIRDLTEGKRLRLFESLLPVCCLCGKVRDDTKTKRGHGSWRALEEYVVEHSDADLTHTFCPDCYRTYREREGLPPAEPPEG